MNLDELKRLARAATPGPWETDGEASYQIGAVNNSRHWIVWEMDNVNREANAAYIALANPATILALIERLESAEGALGRIKTEGEKFRNTTGEYVALGLTAIARAHMEKHNAKP